MKKYLSLILVCLLCLAHAFAQVASDDDCNIDEEGRRNLEAAFSRYNRAVTGRMLGVDPESIVSDPQYRRSDEPSPARLAYLEPLKNYDKSFFGYYNSRMPTYQFILNNKRQKVCYAMFPIPTENAEAKEIYNEGRREFMQGVFQGMKQEVRSKRKNKIYVAGVEFFRRESDAKTLRRTMLSCSDNRFAFRFEAVPFYASLWDNKHYVGETARVYKACSKLLDEVDAKIKLLKKTKLPPAKNPESAQEVQTLSNMQMKQYTDKDFNEQNASVSDTDIRAKFPESKEKYLIIYGLDTSGDLYTAQVPVYDAGDYNNPFYDIVTGADGVIEQVLEMINCTVNPFEADNIKKAQPKTKKKPKGKKGAVSGTAQKGTGSGSKTAAPMPLPNPEDVKLSPKPNAEDIKNTEVK